MPNDTEKPAASPLIQSTGSISGTRKISELTKAQKADFDDQGCGEGYEWWLRHQGLLTSESDQPGERNYPPEGEWYRHIDDYHKWMRDEDFVLSNKE